MQKHLTDDKQSVLLTDWFDNFSLPLYITLVFSGCFDTVSHFHFAFLFVNSHFLSHFIQTNEIHKPRIQRF